MARLKLFIPLLAFLALALLFWNSLGKDTSQIPSALLDKQLPAFSLMALDGSPVSNAAMPKEPFLLNVWASWCYACRIEHPMLERIVRETSTVLIGLNYKDQGGDAHKWLAKFGNPYRLNIADLDGRLGIDLGVVGAPETFIVDSQQVIRYKHTGIVDENVWTTRLQPMLKRLREEQQ